MSENRVLLICTYRLIREGLLLLFADEEELNVIAATAEAEDALDLIKQTQPDVVVFSPGRENCLGSIKKLNADWPGIPVLVVSPETPPESIQAVLQAGATGYLPMDATVDELIRAVYTVGRGERTLHPSILFELLAYLSGQKTNVEHVVHDDLSPREKEVLSKLARGLSDRDIAQELFISVRTVQTHLSHIYKKLGVHSRIEAALIAVQEGWCSTQAPDVEDAQNQ